MYLLGCYKKTTHEFKEILKNHNDEIQVFNTRGYVTAQEVTDMINVALSKQRRKK